MPKERCRHERSWIIMGGHAEWCYVCGAWRQLKRIEPNGSIPNSKWNRPSGDKNINPTPKEIYATTK